MKLFFKSLIAKIYFHYFKYFLRNFRIILCYFNKHDYKLCGDFCSRCFKNHPNLDNIQTRIVLFEKTNKRRMRRRRRQLR